VKMGADGLPCTLMLDVSFLQCNVLSRSCLEPFFLVVAGADKKGMLRFCSVIIITLNIILIKKYYGK